ncbi:MAG: pyruvate dehydrogenase E2 component (dihydrolipoamide acetyltransferase) [Flavobacteriales bacterium]|jgi:pyruvate dehydrogenase E2 component (dihydrolipoamide acetyltransferase)
MAEIVRMPKLSDTMTEGVVAEWHKKVGDEVESGELLADIETDKATLEFESFQDGVLLHIGVEKGKSTAVDGILAILGDAGEDISELLAAEAAAPGGKVAEPAKPEVEAPKAASTPAAKSAPASVAPVVHSSNGRTKASPLAKRLAEEKGISINQVAGSGDGGRVVKRDIENYSPSASGVTTSAVGVESYTDEPVSQMRKVIARRLAESKFSAPHFYLTVSIDMDNAMAARKQINASGDVKVSFNDFVVKATATALRKHPKINSSWLEDVVRYNDHIHIGVAVAVEDGLLVPVVRFADNKSLTQIGAEVKDLAQKAKDKKLQPAEWEGNTFTISNLGMFGIDNFTAIVNPPDACILAIGGISQVPVVKNGAVVPGNVMKVTLSCDHRVIDGATGAAFLQTFKQFLENPVMMIV